MAISRETIIRIMKWIAEDHGSREFLARNEAMIHGILNNNPTFHPHFDDISDRLERGEITLERAISDTRSRMVEETHRAARRWSEVLASYVDAAEGVRATTSAARTFTYTVADFYSEVSNG